MEYVHPNPQIAGFMEDADLEWLFQQAKQMTTILEVGSWKGRSTHALLTGCSGTVHAVDHFLGNPTENLPGGEHFEARFVDIHAQFMANVGSFPNLVVHKMDAAEAVNLFPDRSIDMIFIDTDATPCYYKEMYLRWLPKAKVLFCGHDIDYPDIITSFAEMGIERVKAPGSVSIWMRPITP